MTTTTKSVITMSQRARLHDRIYPPQNVGTGSLLRSPRFARTKWFLPADPAAAHDPAEPNRAVDLAAPGLVEPNLGTPTPLPARHARALDTLRQVLAEPSTYPVCRGWCPTW